MASATVPTVSVVLVSDYAAGSESERKQLRATLAALARQDLTAPVEYLLVQSVPDRGGPAERGDDDPSNDLPGVRVVHAPSRESYELKNHGVARATGEIVVLLDADCRPDADWLRHLIGPFVERPALAAVSGRTTYSGLETWQRILALLSRAYLDPGKAGPTRSFSQNNGACRRDVYLRHPLPTALGAFASGLQSDQMLRDGYELWFEPAAHAVHGFEGWSMDADIRRNLGYGTVITRLHDRRRPFARLVRLGAMAIPLVVAGKALDSVATCFRCWRQYGVRWHELPLALAMVIPLHLMEVPGMWAAYSGRTLSRTSYR